MPSRRWSVILVGAMALLALIAPLRGMCQILDDDEQQRIVNQLATLVNEIQLAMYLMKAGIESPNPRDILINAEEVVDALTGAPSNQVTGAHERVGIIRRLEDVLSCPELEALPDLTEAEFVQDIEHAQVYANFALKGAERIGDALSEEENRVEAKKVYAFLAATLGSDSSPYTLGGVETALSILPSLVVFISEGDSLQDAIDSVLPGGTVFMQPGQYSIDIALFIYKSITLARAPQTFGEVVLSLSTGRYTGGIYVNSAVMVTPIEVAMENITITKSITGLYVSANALLTLRSVSVTESVIGIRLSSGGQAVLEDCTISRNSDYGILATENSRVEARNCTISENGSREGANQIYRTSGGIMSDGAGSITLDTCDITGNLGFGLFSRGAPELLVQNCTLADNTREGILLWDGASLHLDGSRILRNGGAGLRAHSSDCSEGGTTYIMHYFQGEITGSGNNIPEQGEPEGNEGGAVCPADMAGDLTDPSF